MFEEQSKELKAALAQLDSINTSQGNMAQAIANMQAQLDRIEKAVTKP
jgi:hypothetical protein